MTHVEAFHADDEQAIVERITAKLRQMPEYRLFLRRGVVRAWSRRRFAQTLLEMSALPEQEAPH